jgi:DNA uptake protein ComE-like DNA-binding protein
MRIVAIAMTLCLSLITASAFAQVGNNSSVVNPNLADKGALAGLPGLDEGQAEKIIAARPLSSSSAMIALLGDAIAEAQTPELLAQLFVPINLNSASREEIMLVPGISRRMAHEFEEYRPYASMQQFRREIGKYVDEQEVARFEQYVFVPMGLNTASSEDFATIPGMSRSMVHEFEEYRPYASVEQFRREIGKYVDVKEVARLERYVELR